MKNILSILVLLITIIISSCCTKSDCTFISFAIVKGNTISVNDIIEIKKFNPNTNFSVATDSIYLNYSLKEYRITDYLKDYKITIKSTGKVFEITSFTKTTQTCNECSVGSGKTEDGYTRFKLNGVEQGFSNVEINK